MRAAISSMSRLTLIYTIYGLLWTTSGLGVRHTGLAWPVGSTGRCSVSEPLAVMGWFHMHPSSPEVLESEAALILGEKRAMGKVSLKQRKKTSLSVPQW